MSSYNTSNRGSAKKPHLTKNERLPRFFKDLRLVLKSVKSCKGNVQTLVYNSKKMSESTKRRVCSLSCQIIKNLPLITHIIKKLDLPLKEPLLQQDVAEILIHELLFGKKGLDSFGSSKAILTIQKYEQDIMSEYELSKKTGFSSGYFSVPKYVRINSILTTLSEVIEDLNDSGYQLISYESTLSFDDYLKLVKSLEPRTFVMDYHFEDLLVFPSGESLDNWSMFKEGKILIHDKSSYIPVYALDPKPGCVVMDACAAPGMKTHHIIARMKNSGKVFAFDRDQKRFQSMEELLKHQGTKTCKAKCMDFIDVNQHDPKYTNLEYILVDPTCSGSGMVRRMDFATDTEDSKNPERIRLLSGFQIKILKHALAFPTVRRVVYSTCSTNEQENEYVVQEALNSFAHKFKLVEVMPQWPIRGSTSYNIGKLCVRADPEKSLTNGFFVAMFERMEYHEAMSKNMRSGKKKRKFRNAGEDLEADELVNNERVCVNTEQYSDKSSKKKRKHKNGGKNLEAEESVDDDSTDVNTEQLSDKSRKKHKHKNSDENLESDELTNNETSYVNTEQSGDQRLKKKKE